MICPPIADLRCVPYVVLKVFFHKYKSNILLFFECNRVLLLVILRIYTYLPIYTVGVYLSVISRSVLSYGYTRVPLSFSASFGFVYILRNPVVRRVRTRIHTYSEYSGIPKQWYVRDGHKHSGGLRQFLNFGFHLIFGGMVRTFGTLNSIRNYIHGFIHSTNTASVSFSHGHIRNSPNLVLHFCGV